MRTTVHLPSSEACKLMPLRDAAPAPARGPMHMLTSSPSRVPARRAVIRHLTGHATG